MKYHDRIQALDDQITALNNQKIQLIEEAYPIGVHIKWDRSKGMQYGTVIGHGGVRDQRIKVRNRHTHSEYWISFSDVWPGV